MSIQKSCFLAAIKTVKEYQSCKTIIEFAKPLVCAAAKPRYVFLKKKILRHGNKVVKIHGAPNNDYKTKAGNVKFTNNRRVPLHFVDRTYLKYREDILDVTITK